jgi:hypothetical protein
MQELKKESNIISPYIKEFMTEETTTETKTVSLSIGERLKAIAIFDAFKGSISTLATIMDDVKSFPVTPEEWIAVGLKKIVLYKLTDENGKETSVSKEYGQENKDRESFEALEKASGKTVDVQNESWKWEEAEPKDITLNAGTVEYLLSEIKKKDDAQEITLADLPLVSLQNKLK